MESEPITRMLAYIATNPKLLYVSPEERWRKRLDRYAPGWQVAIANLPNAAPLLTIDYKLEGCVPEVPFYQIINAILPHLSDHVLQQLLVTLRSERGWDYYLSKKGRREGPEGNTRGLKSFVCSSIIALLPIWLGGVPPVFAVPLTILIAIGVVFLFLDIRGVKREMQENDLLLQRLERLGLGSQEKT
jgi:hypothetical protein